MAVETYYSREYATPHKKYKYKSHFNTVDSQILSRAYMLNKQARSYASGPSSAEQNRQKTVIGYSLCMVRLPSSSSVRGATAGRDVPEAGRSFRRYSRPHSFPDETQVRLLWKMKSCCFIVSELIRHWWKQFTIIGRSTCLAGRKSAR